MKINFTELQGLRAIFIAANFDIWFVGGCVRDFLRGVDAKDIDLCTDATPDQQIAIYEANGVHYIPTGLQHGTITVVLDQPYEITTLRTETDHTGRHATVAFTRDLREDLSRRDLTINAMALSFNDELIDPFGGEADLKAGRVRFVGNAEERMREDYLRILRFFRFHARIAGDQPPDGDAVKAIRATRAGLSQISAERIWMEMAKIITGPSAAETLRQMMTLTLFEITGMPPGSLGRVQHAQNCGVTDPASVMGFYVLTPADIEEIATSWKWSTQERQRALFIANNHRETEIAGWQEMLVDGAPFEWVADLMSMQGVSPAVLANWPIPKMPVGGGDLIKTGMKPGPQMGEEIKRLTRIWKDSNYAATKNELMGQVVANDIVAS